MTSTPAMAGNRQRILRECRDWLLLVPAIVLPMAALFVDPVAQDPAYHQFADRRSLFGIGNFANVVSNAPFIAVGAVGLILQTRRTPVALPELRVVYLFLFVSLILTGAGSAWYHLAPSNETLAWDRFGITLSIVTLACIIFGEHVSPYGGRLLFLPLLVAGVGSVFWWMHSESLGAGDLRPYALVQFMPMLLIPLILILYRSPFDRSAFIWWMLALYGTAKLFEVYDRQVLSVTGVVSGHSLKHIVAAAAMAVFLLGLTVRRRRP